MNRPPSSHSMRPPSSAASRPASSLSRPSSSASHRTASRLSNRPVSRHSTKPPTRQSIRVAPLIQSLVSLVTGFTEENDETAYNDAIELASKKIDSVTKQGMGIDMQTVEARLKGLAKKSRIKSRDTLADALDISRASLRVEAERESDLDSEIKTSRLPDHMQFLLALASVPSDDTLEYASRLVEATRNPPLPDPGLTWKDILAEEPFEGQHWEGVYGLPTGSVKSEFMHSADSDDESPPLSPISDDDDLENLSLNDQTEESEVSFDVQTPPLEEEHNTAPGLLSQALLLREELESLQRKQYWRDNWRTDADVSRPFDISDAATLGPSLERNLDTAEGVVLTNVENKKYINEHDAVREVLLTLQSHSSIIFRTHYDEAGKFQAIKISETAPMLLHFSRASQASLLSVFATHATSLAHLRLFSKAVVSSVTQTSSSGEKWHLARTVEAFAEAVDAQVRKVSLWCSNREEVMLRSMSKDVAVVVSLLDLSKAFRDEFSETFPSLLDILSSTFRNLPLPLDDCSAMHRQGSPSTQSSTLLDALFTKAQSMRTFGDMKTSTALMEVFIATAEPVWRMSSRWLSDGIFGTTTPGTSHLEDEFYIESNELSVSDRDFWSDGHVLRTATLLQAGDQDDSLCVPVFLRPTADSLLSAGKSMGLLRILDDQGDIKPDVLKNLGTTQLPAFRQFLTDALKALTDESDSGGDSPLEAFRHDRSLTIDDFTLILRERLLPRCQTVEKTLLRVLFSDCQFFEHLSSIEGLFIMHKGDAMADFCEIIFSKMDERKSWIDFHFLNSAFRDTVDYQRNKWINSALVRLTYRALSSSPDSSTARQSVRGIAGLCVEYAAPFPLYYIFDQPCIQAYNEIFVLLVQLRRAKTVLDGILFRRNVTFGLRASESKALYATRGRLSWIVNTIYNFIGQNVLQVETLRLREQLANAVSLDEVIILHRSHLERMTLGCFLDSKTANVRKAILSILDLCMVFGRNFASLSGDANLSSIDASRLSISVSRHKSRRLRRQNKDVISFLDSRPLSLLDDDSEDSDSDTENFTADREPEEVDVSLHQEESDPFSKNEKISADLDGLVRFVRYSVESLSTNASSNKDAGAFEVLSFALQDWDL
ncbi:hypothetical protein SCHPADRAFT_605654 [Schizopora paradoxa]|uniref:Spindle pole body component n=1 Tax=Schizopora paradoxa TaxID=27342 RepID=A0A0H2R9J7_9AGAM|nr:hypothetical protein SCHPADRAFT_605654 [Schizopora paradoxa]